MSAGGAPLLRVEDLSVHFPSPSGVVRALDGVSFQVRRGGTFGVVGESGSGKSTLARAILRLIPRTSGRVVFDQRDLHALRPEELRRTRPRMQMIFQDPAGSLNPRMTVEELVGEALHVHRLAPNRSALRARVAAALARVGLPADAADRYPHQFSGGQRQRIGIARAIVLEPVLLICDEPVSALDVSIQAQILNLLAELRAELGLTYVFIAHNLGVVQHFCDDVAVMQSGRIVEQNGTESLFARPQHEYTRALLAAAPTI